MNLFDVIEVIEKLFFFLFYLFFCYILEYLCKFISYEFVIGIMGKSGVGKFLFCNVLFQGEVILVSDVYVGIWEVQCFCLSGYGYSMVIIDLFGVGESWDRDVEYEVLYCDILFEFDLVLWLIKVDDCVLFVDEYFW